MKFQITIDNDSTAVLWSEDAVLKRDKGFDWFDTNCKDRGEVIQYHIAEMLLDGKMPKFDEIVKMNVEIL